MAHLKHMRAKWLAQAGLAAPAPVPAPAAASAASAPLPKPEQRPQQTAQPQAAPEQHRGTQANGGPLLPKKRLLEAAGAAGQGPGPGQQDRCACAQCTDRRRSTRRV